MKKYEIIINMKNNSVAFWHDHYIYIRVASLTILNQLRLLIEIIAVRIWKNITPQKIEKTGLIVDMNDFLQTINKLFSKNKRQINKSK